MPSKFVSLNYIPVYEKNSQKLEPGVGITIKISNELFDDDFIKITINGDEYTVIGRDLIKAVNNALNTH